MMGMVMMGVIMSVVITMGVIMMGGGHEVDLFYHKTYIFVC